MERRMMLKDTKTGRWGWYTIGRPVRMPWNRAWTGLRWLFRYARRHNALLPYESEETMYDLDPDTLRMRDPKGERRTRRRERRAERFAKTAHAVMAMVEMQKHIG